MPGGSFSWQTAGRGLWLEKSKSTEGVRVAEEGGSEGSVDPRLIELATEPVGYRVLAFLDEQPEAGAARIAAELGLDAETAKAKLEDMSERGLVERVEGATGGEPGYRRLVRALWSDREVAELSIGERNRLYAWIASMVAADVEQAIAAGTLGRNVDTHFSRVVPRVDARGWRELTRILDEALAAILAVQEAAAERLAEGGENGIPVLSAMLCCELPNDEQRSFPG